MTQRASGTFEVSMKPLAPPEESGGVSLARMSLDKEFSGDLEAVGKGEVLTALTATNGSAGYVALERVTGTLLGRKGSFVFQHSGTMKRGAPELVVRVVPDSGTDELAGIAGEFTINIVDGKHSYVFDFSVPG
jgi:hypothetical protein